MTMDCLERKWYNCANRLQMGKERRELCWTLLTALYAGRAYHNINHVGDCIALLHKWDAEKEVDYALEIETALWWHDAVYDAKAAPGCNEFKSAELASMVLQQSPSFIDRVMQCIIATRHMDNTLPHEYMRITADIDLAGLCLDEDQFLANSRRIRTEFAHLDDLVWRKGRRAWLLGMLARRAVYTSARFSAAAESKARRNLQAELDWLCKFGDPE